MFKAEARIFILHFAFFLLLFSVLSVSSVVK